MRNVALASLVSVALLGVASSTAYAQKGVGDSTGVASRAVKPEIISLSGKMVEIRTGLCESSTGRSPVGTHIILETPKGKSSTFTSDRQPPSPTWSRSSPLVRKSPSRPFERTSFRPIISWPSRSPPGKTESNFGTPGYIPSGLGGTLVLEATATYPAVVVDAVDAAAQGRDAVGWAAGAVGDRCFSVTLFLPESSCRRGRGTHRFAYKRRGIRRPCRSALSANWACSGISGVHS